MLERGKIGSDTLSTLYIHQPGVEELRGLGIEMGDTLEGAPAISKMVYEVNDIRIVGKGPWYGKEMFPTHQEEADWTALSASKQNALVPLYSMMPR
mgnify:CR=1 FL=1